MKVLFQTVLAIMLWMACGACVGAADSDLASVDGAIAKYGKEQLVQMILTRRGGVVTIEKSRALADFQGMPNLELVTANSIARDLKATGIAVGDLGAILSSGSPQRAETAVTQLALDELTLQLRDKAAEVNRLNGELDKLKAALKRQESAAQAEKSSLTRERDARDKRIGALLAEQQEKADIAKQTTLSLQLLCAGLYGSALVFILSGRMANLRRRLADMFVYSIPSCQRLHKGEWVVLLGALFVTLAYLGGLAILLPASISQLWLIVILATVLCGVAVYWVKHRLKAKPAFYASLALSLLGIAGSVYIVMQQVSEAPGGDMDFMTTLLVDEQPYFWVCLFLVLLGGISAFHARAKQKRLQAFAAGTSWWN